MRDFYRFYIRFYWILSEATHCVERVSGEDNKKDIVMWHNVFSNIRYACCLIDLLGGDTECRLLRYGQVVSGLLHILSIGIHPV